MGEAMSRRRFYRIVRECFANKYDASYFEDNDVSSSRYFYFKEERFQEVMGGLSISDLEDMHLGSELIKRRGSVRMFSVASSSRLCCKYFQIHNRLPSQCAFECLLPLGGDGTTDAHLDAFEVIDGKNVYYECKCLEIMGNHSKFGFSKAYQRLLVNEMKIAGFVPGKGNYTVKQFLGKDEDKDEDIVTVRFDLRQFICHLLGIAEKIRTDVTLIKNPTLQYIFFWPDTKNGELDGIYERLENEVQSVFKARKVKDFCDAHGISLAAKYVMLPAFTSEKPFASYSPQVG